ncbi:MULTISPECIES: response regulator transcription factor [Mesobacillus]|jgi:two-component system, OmpR family, response regulator ResD|uniref:response regulator transcription factor n=1 Tax=Mesobacillus TaxID=2675231 RepID=UPI00177C6377|nr:MULTISPECIES: response regulator transcription factor [Mesobacillus]MCM3576105.1 response regulator transcription factor [Mesobacillus subterraneus]UYZ19960.1 response regulator transcription factor [Mesobacillus jeotgali]
MNKILIVDDEAQMRKLVKLYLLQEGYHVEEAEDGQEAIDMLRKDDYDLMILDVMMPMMDGWETIQHVRKMSDLPIIMLTAKGAVQDKVTGLSTGADDYLVKPFDEAELLVRVKALLRRTGHSNSGENILKYQGMVIDLIAREAMYEGLRINLTQTEFDILAALIEHRGKVLSREQLVDMIWGIEFMGEDRTVDSHIKNLREKLQKAGVDKSIVKTVWGIGYKME